MIPEVEGVKAIVDVAVSIIVIGVIGYAFAVHASWMLSPVAQQEWEAEQQRQALNQREAKRQAEKEREARRRQQEQWQDTQRQRQAEEKREKTRQWEHARRQEEEQQRADARPWCEVLGVSPQASAEEIRRSYATKIKLYHPDLVNGMGPELVRLAEVKTKELNEAFAQAKRAQ